MASERDNAKQWLLLWIVAAGAIWAVLVYLDPWPMSKWIDEAISWFEKNVFF